MRQVICFLLLPMTIVHGTLTVDKFINSKPYIDIDVNVNARKIQKIFQKIPTINVLLENYEQPAGIVKMLENIFGGSGNKSFVVFNFPSEMSKREWIKECKDYLSNPGYRTAYYERRYQKSFENEQKTPSGLRFEEEFEQELDPQAAPASTTSNIQVQEKFANLLDKWLTYRNYGYVIFSSLDVLDYYIKCLSSRSGTYFFIIDNLIIDKNYFKIINSTFHKAWNSTSNLKLHILIERKIFTFNPFARSEDGRHFGKTQLLDEDNIITETNLVDLNGYPLKIEMFWSVFSAADSTESFNKLDFKKFIGPDVEVARMIVEQMNVTMSLIPNKGKFGGKYPNGTLSGALGNLQQRKSDIALTAFFLKDYETRAAEFTYPLYTDRLCVVVRKAGRIPSEMLPMVIFTESLWIVLFLAYILIATIWTILRSINNCIRRPSIDADYCMIKYNLSPFLARQSRSRQYMQIFMDTLMLYLSIPMRRLTRAQYERLFVASVCLVSIIFVSIYQSLLATVFVRPLYFRDIDSLEMLDKSINNIYVKYSGFLTDVFPNDTSQLYRNLRDKMKLFETQMDAMDIVKYHEKVATVTRENTIWLDNFLYFYLKVLYLIDKECPKNYFLSYMVPVKSPYLHLINRILVKIHRYGFIEKWINDFYFATELKNMETMTITENVKNTKILTLNDLKFPFYALIGGCSLSIVVLILEILITFVGRRAKKNDKVGPERYLQKEEANDVVDENLDEDCSNHIDIAPNKSKV